MSAQRDAWLIKRLSEIGGEISVLRVQVEGQQKKIANLAEEAKELEDALLKSMKEQDVYASGNYGHDVRKIQWLCQLAMVLKRGEEDFDGQ